MSPVKNIEQQDEQKEGRGQIVKNDYSQKQKALFEDLIRKLDLEDIQKKYLHDRWLEQMLWMDTKANDNQKPYNRLRKTALILGAIVPALISLSLPQVISATSLSGWIEFIIKIITIVLSIVVVVSTGIEQFFNYGERWRHFRKTAELLKIEGWAYFTLSDRYEKMKTHAKAFKTFADQTEMLIKTDVNTYIAQIVKETTKVPQQNP